jgi:hypothetical protein
MAVAAYEDCFSLYALKSMDEIRGAVQRDGAMDESRFQPVKEVSVLLRESAATEHWT